MMRRLVFLAILVWPIAQNARAAALSEDQRQQILSEAQQAYDLGVSTLRSTPREAAASFETAAQRYRQLLDDGVVNGALHYNLANAYLQDGELGRAILHYRAARKLIPLDPRLKHNLEYARGLRRSRIPPSGGRALTEALLFWHHETSAGVRFGVFTAAWLGFWIMMGLNLYRPRLAWGWPAAALAAIWLACAVSVASDVWFGDHLEGVVLADDVIVRKGNSEGFEPQFEEPLHQGVEFRVLEKRPGWLHIELANSKTGWIRTDQAGLLG